MAQAKHRGSALSRRDVLKRGGTIGAGVAAGIGFTGHAAAGRLVLPSAQEATKRKVIFVNHDNNPFFAPVKAGLEDFAQLVGWETQFTGPATPDAPTTVELQAQAIAAKPDAVGFTRIDTTSFDDNIRQAQEQGIFVILFNTASEGYKDLGVAYIGQVHELAAETNGYEAARHAQEITGRTDGKIIMGIIQPGHSALEARHRGTTTGVNRYNQENGTTYTTEPLETSTDGPTSIARQQAKYSADGDEIVGWAHADFGHMFTAQFARDNGLQGKFSNGGFDLLDQVLEAIKSGDAQWSVSQNPYAQGWVTSALIHSQLEVGSPPSDYIIGAELVDAANIDAIIEREARWKEVDVSS